MVYDLNLSDEQRQILDAAGAMLDTHYPLSRLSDGGPEILVPIAEFGLFGGAGPDGTFPDPVTEAHLHTALGRHLVDSGVIAAALAVRLAGMADWTDTAGIAAGTVSVAPAVETREGLLLLSGGDLAGRRLALLFGCQPLALVDLTDLNQMPVAGLGGMSGLARCDAAPDARRIEANDPAVGHLARLLVSAHLLGIAEASRDLAVGYASIREQFGQPIGAFQAIKHQAADMAIRAEMLSAQLDMAALALEGGGDDAAFQGAMLARLAPGIALANARACIQIHGGIGFSSEADAHHYVKRAHLLSRLLGPVDDAGLTAPLSPLSEPFERI